MKSSIIIRRRQKRLSLIKSIFFVLLALVSGYILLRSPLFELQHIQVKGNNTLVEEKILAAADMGIGENIFKLDLELVSSNLKLVPMIKEAEVYRSLPGTVIINVQERRPVGLLATGEGFIEVDGEGVYLQKAGAGTPGLPVITGVRGNIPGLGHIVEADGLGDALSLIRELPAEIITGLSEIHISGDGQLIIYTIEGLQCRLGSATNIKEKAAVFNELLQELRKQGNKVKYIDLSSAGQPVVFYHQ